MVQVAKRPKIQQKPEGRRVSMFDVDFLIFALPLAFMLDALSYIVLGVDGGIIAAIVNFVFGGLLVLWARWKGKKLNKKTARKILKRALILYGVNTIPIVNFIPWQIIGLILLLRKK